MEGVLAVSPCILTHIGKSWWQLQPENSQHTCMQKVHQSKLDNHICSNWFLAACVILIAVDSMVEGAPDGDHGSLPTQRPDVTATVAICAAHHTLYVTRPKF